MKLVLVRHGESIWNKENKFTGWTDVELSEYGKIEAQNAGKILLEQNYDFDICYTSFLKRAIMTLEIILHELDKMWLPVIKSPSLNERHYGALQGVDKSRAVQKYGENQVKIWRRSFKTRPPLLEPTDVRNPKNFAPYKNFGEKLPLGESLEDVLERVLRYFNTVIKPEIMASKKTSHEEKAFKKVLIVAHGNTIRAFAKHFENLPEDELMKLEIPTGIPLVYELDDNFRFKSKNFL